MMTFKEFIRALPFRQRLDWLAERDRYRSRYKFTSPFGWPRRTERKFR